MSNSSLINEYVPAYTGNYTRGRGGNLIQKITVHHMAANGWSAKRCGESFQAVGRKGSSHYGIGINGEIAQYVNECDTAWTDGNWKSNQTSITIEVANNSGHPNWTVSDASLNSLIKLIADIAKRNNLGTLVPGANLTWHQLMSNDTACPGPYLLPLVKDGYIAEEANKILNEVILPPGPEEGSIKIKEPNERYENRIKPNGVYKVNESLLFDKYTEALDYLRLQYQINAVILTLQQEYYSIINPNIEYIYTNNKWKFNNYVYPNDLNTDQYKINEQGFYIAEKWMPINIKEKDLQSKIEENIYDSVPTLLLKHAGF